MKVPKVSLGMPIYNGAKFLRSRIPSMLGQTFSDFELRICDNASTDATSDLLRELAASDSRVTIVRHPATIPPADNFRASSIGARGDYFAFAACDDAWEPTFLERMVRALDERSDAVTAFCRFDDIDDDDRVVVRFREDWREIFSRPKREQLAAFIEADPAKTHKAHHFYGLHRRARLFATEEFFDYDIYGGSDSLQLYSLLCRGEITIVDELLFHYRVRTPKPRPNTAIADYVWKRMFSSVKGRRSNLLRALWKERYHHSALREVILESTPLPSSQIAELYLRSWRAEARRYLVEIPAAALREIRRA